MALPDVVADGLAELLDRPGPDRRERMSAIAERTGRGGIGPGGNRCRSRLMLRRAVALVIPDVLAREDPLDHLLDGPDGATRGRRRPRPGLGEQDLRLADAATTRSSKTPGQASVSRTWDSSARRCRA